MSSISSSVVSAGRVFLCIAASNQRHGMPLASLTPTRCGFTRREGAVHAALRLFSFIVLALMASGIAYASYIGLTYWSGIGV